MHNPPPSVRARLSAALAVGLIIGFATTLHLTLRSGIQASDFTYPWLAARAVLAGSDPYVAVPAAHPPWAPWFLYPLPAALVAVPLAWLPMRVAAGVFVGASSGLLAFAVTRAAWWPLLMFVSAPAVVLVRSAQGWASLFLAASFWVPALGLVAAKPNIALPMFARQTTMRGVWVGAVSVAGMLVLSLLVKPDWPLEWWRTVHDTPPYGSYIVPIRHPFGIVAVLAVLRWRRPEARLLFAMALCPQNAYFYDQMPLMLVPQSRLAMLGMGVVSQIAGALAPAMSDARVPYMLVGLYWPAVALVLLQPNVGTVPAWVDRLTGRVPLWLRGVPA